MLELTGQDKVEKTQSHQKGLMSIFNEDIAYIKTQFV